MGKIVNQAELCEIVGLSDVSIWQMQSEGLPVLKRGARGQENAYDAPAVVAWLIERAVAKACRETPHSRLARLQGDRVEQQLAVEAGRLVPVDQIEPTWRYRVLSAAAFLSGQHSRLAGVLEATAGVDAKRKVLREEFGQFLTRLGVDGGRMQDEIERLLREIPEARAAAFLRDIGIVGGPPGG